MLFVHPKVWQEMVSHTLTDSTEHHFEMSLGGEGHCTTVPMALIFLQTLKLAIATIHWYSSQWLT